LPCEHPIFSTFHVEGDEEMERRQRWYQGFHERVHRFLGRKFTARASQCVPFPPELRQFVDTTTWTFAKTYAKTWPHEYVVRNAENSSMIRSLAQHILHFGIEERFYDQVRPYHREDGKVYWVMGDSAEKTVVINRCGEDQTYEARVRAGLLPDWAKQSP
jgi:hypothetical protein